MRLLVPALLTLALAAGCGGGGGTEGTGQTGSPAATSPAATTPVAGPSESPSTVSKHGSAQVTYRGTTTAWVERGCETTRGMDGEVVGWMATFQDPVEVDRRYQTGITDSKSYVTIRVRGGYAGNGSYASERVSFRLGVGNGAPLATGFGTPGQQLTLREGGKAGTYRSKDATVEFTCDPADDTSTDAGPVVPATPAAGTAYVVRPEGAVFTYDRVRCAKERSDLSVTAGTFPHFFRLLTGAEAGDPGAGRVLFAVQGVVIPFSETNTRVEVAGDPVTSGTFRYSPSGPNATTDVTRAAFACG